MASKNKAKSSPRKSGNPAKRNEAKKPDPARSGNPAKRSEALEAKTSPESDGLSSWVKVFLVVTLLSSLGLTLSATWGFSGTPSAEAFLISGMVSMLALSAAAFFLDRFIYRQKSGVPAKARLKKAIVVVIVLLIGLTVLGTALGGTQTPDNNEPNGQPERFDMYGNPLP